MKKKLNKFQIFLQFQSSTCTYIFMYVFWNKFYRPSSIYVNDVLHIIIDNFNTIIIRQICLLSVEWFEVDNKLVKSIHLSQKLLATQI